MTLASDQLYYDIRAIHDMASLRFDTSDKVTERAWMLVELAPLPYSGSARIIDHRLVTVSEGSWKLIVSLDRSSDITEGAYRWTTSQDHSKRSIEPADIYSPFDKGGTVLCRYNRRGQGAGRFEPSYLIPSQWENDVQAAHNYVKSNVRLFGSPRAKSQTKILLQLVEGSNPFLSIMAFQQLIEREEIGGLSLDTVLERSEHHKRAVLIYLLLVNSKTADSTARATINHVLANARNANELRAIALGVFSAALFHRDVKVTQELGRELLMASRDRAAKVGADTDPDLLSIFKDAGVIN